MRRFGIILLVIATAMAMALPAGAKRKSPVAEYTVDISTVGAEGVATTCGGEVVLQRGRSGIHYESWGATLNVSAGDLAWEGTPLSGCHGNLVVPEYFRITLQDDGTVAMLWIFDVAEIEEIVTHGRSGKAKVETSRTDFRMGGPYADADGTFATATTGWDPETGWGEGVIELTVTGSFAFVHFASGGDPLFTELDGSPRTFTLNMTLTPNG